MAFFIGGHDQESDSLNGRRPDPSQDRTRENGYLYDEGSIKGPRDFQTQDPQGWGELGYRTDENGRAIEGTSGADVDASRYRDLGARREASIALDQRQANQARGQQTDALALQRDAARGGAPSRAAELGKLATTQGSQQAAAAQVGRGLGGSLRATRAAVGGQGQAGGSAAMQAGDMRAQEMAANRQGYMGGASGMRRQDIGAATANAKLEAQQRALEEQRQQAYEKMAWDTQNAQMFGQIEKTAMREKDDLERRQLRDAEAQADLNKIKDVATYTTAGLGGAMASDRRAKNVVPYGSLGPLMARRK